GRRVVFYAVGLLAVYVGAVLLFRPGPADLIKVAIPAMFAPTVGALAAVLFAHGRVILGRPTKHVLLAFLPPLVILVTTWVASWVSDIEVHPGRLGTLLLLSPVLALLGSLTAVGEEVGWRGFLWPLLRRRGGFWWSAAVMVPVWWLYHLPGILWWGYGFLGGLPAFSVAIVGFILFVGVLTERSQGIWASVLAHGAWNGIVAAGFVAAIGAHHPTCGTAGCEPFSDEAQVFTGSQTLLGEFGWIAAVTMLVLGVVSAMWHLRHPVAVATDLTARPAKQANGEVRSTD
ncbi:MAG: type II CAAX endopeptidase family protein, partial [Lapillicoccus sp.]